MDRFVHNGYAMVLNLDGAWVKHADAQAAIAAADQRATEAERRLALAVAEVRKWREGHDADNDDHGPFLVYAEDVTPCEEEMCEYMKQLEAARRATDADPVLAKMIGGGE